MAPVKPPVPVPFQNSWYTSNRRSSSSSTSSSSLETSYLTFDAMPPPPMHQRAASSFSEHTSARASPIHGHPTGRYSMTEEEFHSLPLAVRRKYFSTLERLRFAQKPDRDRDHREHREHQDCTARKESIADRRGLSITSIEPRRRLRKSAAAKQRMAISDTSWYLTLPDKVAKKNLTREEQVALASGFRKSVLADAANHQATYRRSRSSPCCSPAVCSEGPYAESMASPWASRCTPYTAETASSMASRYDPEVETGSSIAETILENCHWNDQENLNLDLDEYHSTLKAQYPRTTSDMKPSFRRHMSITQLPFGRASMLPPSLSSPSSPRSMKFDRPISMHMRSRSRAMSLMSPRHVGQDSISSMDPNAAHYTDPEARLKLRVFLASPQKFEEALQFGFPSTDKAAESDKENAPERRSSIEGQSKKASHQLSDSASWFEDDASMTDPDSPLTPLEIESGYRSKHIMSSYGPGSGTSPDCGLLGLSKAAAVKPFDQYPENMAGAREMTLRMTLTRPDLREREGAAYGWQTTLKDPLEEERSSSEAFADRGDRGPLGGADGWAVEKQENGVVRRFFKKLKNQRKASQ